MGLLEETDYEKKHWFVFNFNDAPMAFTTWFTNLLEEYVPEQADALQRVCKWGDFAWYIFPTFYIIGVSILFEVLVAFTVELYLALKEEHDGEEAEEENPNEEQIGKDAAAEQAAMIVSVQNRLAEKNEALHYSMKDTATALKSLVNTYKEKLHEAHGK